MRSKISQTRQSTIFVTLLLIALGYLLPVIVIAKPDTTLQTDNYDYLQNSRQLIRRGQQAMFMCNGLFTSNRTLKQVFKQELAFLPRPIGNRWGGQYEVHMRAKAVTVGSAKKSTPITAVFRTGIGCVVLAPNQTLADAQHLPTIELNAEQQALKISAATTAWPMGDETHADKFSSELEKSLNKSLNKVWLWSFKRKSAEQITTSLLVVHKNQIVLERYAPGFSRDTRTRTWSTAKSIAVTLIGLLADKGQMSLDQPLGITWLPKNSTPKLDPRQAITLRQTLNMSSGLVPVDNNQMEYASGSGLSYWVGASSSLGARDRGLIAKPGTQWDYENYDTLAAVYAMKTTLIEVAESGDALLNPNPYHQFPRQALLDKLGMHSTLLGTDRFGDFVLSSQVYTNTRDLARFGLLYLNQGKWQGEQILSTDWIDFVRTPAPATRERGSYYGGHWWLVPDDRTDVPKDAYATAGNRGQYVIVVPSQDLVIVRRGLDYGKQGFDRWELTSQIIDAINADQ